MKEVITIEKGYRGHRSYLRALLFLALTLFLFACNRTQPPPSVGPVAVLTLEASEEVAAAEIVLQYDPSFFEFVEVVRADTQSGILAEAYADGQGNVTIGLVSSLSSVGKVLDVVFRELQPGGTVKIERARAFDANAVETQAVTTSFQLGQGHTARQTYDAQAQLEALSTMVGTLAVPGEPELEAWFADYDLGDITRSDGIDVLDVLQTLNISTGKNRSPSAYQLYHANLNSDSEIDVQDVLMLLKKAVDPTLEASLQVAPHRVSFAYIQEGRPILVGNAGNRTLPALETVPSPSSTMSLRPAGGSQGKAYTVDVNVSAGWKNGTALFRAGSAGEVRVLVGNITLLIAGQSNASGYGYPLDNKENGIPQVRMLGNDYVWKQAEEPLDDPTGQRDSISKDSSSVGHSFGVRLGKQLAEATDRYVYLIPSARGSSSTGDWLPPSERLDVTTLFGSANYRAQTSSGQVKDPAGAEGGPVTAIIWYQGESDRHGNQDGFIRQTNTIMEAFRQELHKPPVIYVQLGVRLKEADESNDTPNKEYQGIRERQRLMETGSGTPDARSDFYMVVAHDLPMSDRRHLSAEGQRILGDRIALAYREHVLGENVDGTGPRLSRVRFDGSKTVTVETTQPINDHSSYDNYFQVYVDGSTVSISDIRRDPSNNRAVRLTLRNNASGTVTVEYGPPPERSYHVRMNNVVQNDAGLPLPAFGPVTASR